jgi:hypothetical protein
VRPTEREYGTQTSHTTLGERPPIAFECIQCYTLIHVKSADSRRLVPTSTGARDDVSNDF